VKASNGFAGRALYLPSDKAGAEARALFCAARTTHEVPVSASYSSLTQREREMLPLLASGLLKKQATAVLGITEYTVQVHRGNIMRKMKADSFATLVRMAEKLNPGNP
jgi:FixJ family two-component response regulator